MVEEAVEQGVVEAVRMVLSGVARSRVAVRLRQEPHRPDALRLQFGKVKKLRLNQLTTFGLLSHLKQTEVATLIEILIAIGCLEQEEIDRFRPVLKLTPLGGEVMRGKADLPVGLKLPGELRLKLRRPAARTAGARLAEPRSAARSMVGVRIRRCIGVASCRKSGDAGPGLGPRPDFR